MYLGRVVGTVVAATKAEGLVGQKLLLVQPLDDERQSAGPVEVAIDTVRAGRGDVVFLASSREAALALEESFVPVDAAIVGFVDDAGVGGSIDDAGVGGSIDDVSVGGPIDDVSVGGPIDDVSVGGPIEKASAK